VEDRDVGRAADVESADRNCRRPRRRGCGPRARVAAVVGENFDGHMGFFPFSIDSDDFAVLDADPFEKKRKGSSIANR